MVSPPCSGVLKEIISVHRPLKPTGLRWTKEEGVAIQNTLKSHYSTWTHVRALLRVRCCLIMLVVPICECDAGGPPLPSHVANWLPAPDMGEEATCRDGVKYMDESHLPDEAFSSLASIQSFDISSLIFLSAEKDTHLVNEECGQELHAGERCPIS
jgi:hypothetical protein